MPCCKCIEFGWPDPQPDIHTDEAAGLDYCLFHAPAEHKGMSVEDFNAQVFARIDAVKAKNTASSANDSCNLSGTIFPGEISFRMYDEDNPLPGIDFSEANFGGAAGFSGAKFSGEAYFLGTTFTGNAYFMEATFSDHAYFRGSTFSGQAEFRGATLTGMANFMKVTFTGMAFFGLATFSDEALFWGATFSDVADFRGATFSGRTHFTEATFRSQADFWRAKFNGGAHFHEATFGGTADFLITEFDAASFKRATFTGEANFLGAKFSSNVDYQAATFSGNANFVYFTCGGQAYFKDIQAKANTLRLHSLQIAALANLSFTSMETECFSFKGCDWPEKLWPETQEKPDYKFCEELYRSLKQKAAGEHDQPLVSKWHYREKLMGLKKLISDKQALKLLDVIEEDKLSPWRKARSAAHLLRLAPGLLLSLNFWYWAISGYGEREKRAGVLLALLAVLPFVLNAFPHPIEAFPFSEQVNNALAHFPFAKDIQGQGGWLRLGKGLSQLLLALLATLFGLALRNRFRR